ncbi:acyltransferase family protein [Hymenobacter norwichensis]|uniref:acyltransferase family protein n=1 Tax=Hymenobacter norwichensis TaxID=223903 RepID=UPI0003B3F6A2|nr:acyltransferase [Hymenobacter norwichensis]
MVTTTSSEKAKGKKAIYFPGLNALRYFAAAAVVVCHVEEMKGINLLPNHYATVYGLGTLAVTFFFVLSGFLITYLLLVEKKESNTVRIKNFYVRRALRIWPLYYLIAVLGLLVIPYISALAIPEFSAKVVPGYPVNIALYALFLPNIASGLKYYVPYASQLWSVGVEEQFYLFWPWIFKYVKKPLPFILAVIVVFVLMRMGCTYVMAHWPEQQSSWSMLYKIIDLTRIDCMAVGGIGAYLLYQETAWFRTYFINYKAELASVVLPLVLVATSTKLGDVQHTLYAFCFLIFIINVSCKDKSFFRLEGRIWAFLGNISYSIYMYQYLAIGLVLLLFKKVNALSFTAPYTILFHVLCQLLVIVIAQLSYRFLETPFLKLKKKFMIVQSTTDAPTTAYAPLASKSLDTSVPIAKA